jgi:hypothetical protein
MNNLSVACHNNEKVFILILLELHEGESICGFQIATEKNHVFFVTRHPDPSCRP